MATAARLVAAVIQQQKALPAGFQPANASNPCAALTSEQLLRALGRTAFEGEIGSPSVYSNFRHDDAVAGGSAGPCTKTRSRNSISISISISISVSISISISNGTRPSR